ncbi:MAG: hypothetical protein HKN40_02725, partial [Winogradskyella sp.]|nr:hypothetical protein [Winogradskyella sp.]
MKKVLLIGILGVSFLNLNSQESNASEIEANPKSEIKLNALYMVAGAFDVAYEHLLSEESGVGVELFLPYDEDIKDDIDYYLSPYYRMYFGNKYAAGF